MNTKLYVLDRDSYFSFGIVFFSPFLTNFFNITVCLSGSAVLHLCDCLFISAFLFWLIFMFILECGYEALDFTKD